MDLILHILGFICLLIGLAGAILPLPGPPASFVGILLLQATEKLHFSDTFLWSWGIITLVSVGLDYYAPIYTAQKVGGTKWGTWGASIGMLVGLFLGPMGLFIGAFVGAWVGELAQGASANQALKVAFGTFLGFAAGIILKLCICIYLLGAALVAYF